MAWPSNARTKAPRPAPGMPPARAPSAKLVLALFLLSVITNLFLINGIRHKFLPQPIHSAQPVPEVVATTAAEARKSKSLKAASQTSEASRFAWAMLQSADPRVYAQRLFAAGCPRPVVRAIIAKQLVDARELEYAGIAPPPFWSSAPEHRAACLRAYEERLRITQKYDALAREIVGMRCLESFLGGSDLVISDLVAQVLAGQMQTEALDDFGRFGYRIMEAQKPLGSLPPLSRYRAQIELGKWGEQVLPEIVGNLHEFKKRTAALVLLFSSKLPDSEAAGFFITGAELERLSDRLAGELNIHQMGEDIEEIIEEKTMLTVEQCLTAARFREFCRAKDDDFLKALDACSGELEIKRQKAGALYELKMEAEANWVAIQQDGALDVESRRAQFDQVRQQCTQRAKEILGEQALQELQKQKPYWLLSPVTKEVP